jgi:hypothetical protein
MVLNKKLVKQFIFLAALQFSSLAVLAQGIIIQGQDNQVVSPPIAKIDPARYHKIQIVDINIGSLYSDDRGFQSLLKYYGLNQGKGNFGSIGIDYNFYIKRFKVGAYGFLADQNSNAKPALWHANLLGNLGYALYRHNSTLFSVSANLGVETSTIRFGYSPPDFLAKLNYSHDASKLFQNQFIMGPSISFQKLFNKMHMDKGFSLGIDAGVNFAPFKPVWKYGYDDENYDFIGEEIFDMPQAARQTFYTTLKLGFWSAK